MTKLYSVPSLTATGDAEPFQGLLEVDDDGHQVYVEDTGGPGVPLFFTYGLGCSIQHWKYPRQHFGEEAPGARRRRQIYLDFRGHGESPATPDSERLTLSTLVADIKAVSRARGINRMVILGQSMGGGIALQLASEEPDLVAAAVLLASPGRDPTLNLPVNLLAKPAWLALIKANELLPGAPRLVYQPLRAAQRGSPIRFLLREAIRLGGFNRKLSRTTDIDDYVDHLMACDPKLFYDLAGDLRHYDAATIDPAPQQPVLVIAGAEDDVVPLSESERLAKCLPRAELFVVPHGSHCPHFDDPGLVNRKLETFLLDHQL